MAKQEKCCLTLEDHLDEENTTRNRGLDSENDINRRRKRRVITKISIGFGYDLGRKNLSITRKLHPR